MKKLYRVVWDFSDPTKLEIVERDWWPTAGPGWCETVQEACQYYLTQASFRQHHGWRLYVDQGKRIDAICWFYGEQAGLPQAIVRMRLPGGVSHGN